jgi:hypothetical protein
MDHPQGLRDVADCPATGRHRGAVQMVIAALPRARDRKPSASVVDHLGTHHSHVSHFQDLALYAWPPAYLHRPLCRMMWSAMSLLRAGIRCRRCRRYHLTTPTSSNQSEVQLISPLTAMLELKTSLDNNQRRRRCSSLPDCNSD